MSNENFTVLVTGASGFVAQHVVKTVLEAGFKVRGTVRDPTNEKKCKPLRELCPQAATKLELVKADLLNAEDWPAAVKGCQFVLHVASPLPQASPRNADEVIQPALQGTKNVLKVIFIYFRRVKIGISL